MKNELEPIAKPTRDVFLEQLRARGGVVAAEKYARGLIVRTVDLRQLEDLEAFARRFGLDVRRDGAFDLQISSFRRRRVLTAEQRLARDFNNRHED